MAIIAARSAAFSDALLSTPGAASRASHCLGSVGSGICLAKRLYKSALNSMRPAPMPDSPASRAVPRSLPIKPGGVTALDSFVASFSIPSFLAPAAASLCLPPSAIAAISGDIAANERRVEGAKSLMYPGMFTIVWPIPVQVPSPNAASNSCFFSFMFCARPWDCTYFASSTAKLAKSVASRFTRSPMCCCMSPPATARITAPRRSSGMSSGR